MQQIVQQFLRAIGVFGKFADVLLELLLIHIPFFTQFHQAGKGINWASKVMRYDGKKFVFGGIQPR